MAQMQAASGMNTNLDNYHIERTGSYANFDHFNDGSYIDNIQEEENHGDTGSFAKKR